MEQPERPAAPPISPLVDWVSRNSGIILFVMLLGIAMLEGVAIYAAKRRDAALSPPPPPTQP